MSHLVYITNRMTSDRHFDGRRVVVVDKIVRDPVMYVKYAHFGGGYLRIPEYNYIELPIKIYLEEII